MPGAYRLKRGHWRVRDCDAFRQWWSRRAAMPLRFAIQGDEVLKSKAFFNVVNTAKQMTSLVMKNAPHILKLEKVVALETRSGSQGGWVENPHEYWWDTPIGDLPHKLHAMAGQADEKALDVAVAVGELTAKGITPTAANVAKLLGISRATFYRRSFAADFKRCLRALNTG
jgi:hypothetical protein